MTPEERAKGIIGERHWYGGPGAVHSPPTCGTCIAEAAVAKRIREGEEAMRERCAKIVLEHGSDDYFSLPPREKLKAGQHLKQIADKILGTEKP